jgi:hypothetical protein
MTLPQYIRPSLLRKVYPDLVVEDFNSLASWRAWKDKNAWITDRKHINSMLTHVQSEGIKSLWFGDISPTDVTVVGEDVRRSVAAPMWIFERHRMLLDLIASMALTADTARVRIYAGEAQSAWALAMRSRYPRFLGSEYRPEPNGEKVLWPIQHQDLTKLTYPDRSFDLAVTQEILEHVPDLPSAMYELARILRPGGVMLSTFPFRWEAQDTEVSARLRNGQIEHLMVPQYHSDPQRSEGALVFQTPGWDVLDLAAKSGFSISSATPPRR